MSQAMFILVLVVVPLGLNLALWKITMALNKVTIKGYHPFLTLNVFLFGPNDGGFWQTLCQLSVYIALYAGAYTLMGMSLTGHVSAILTDLLFVAVTRRFMCYTSE